MNQIILKTAPSNVSTNKTKNTAEKNDECKNISLT